MGLDGTTNKQFSVSRETYGGSNKDAACALGGLS
jgi:hypothetical protein